MAYCYNSRCPAFGRWYDQGPWCPSCRNDPRSFNERVVIQNLEDDISHMQRNLSNLQNILFSLRRDQESRSMNNPMPYRPIVNSRESREIHYPRSSPDQRCKPMRYNESSRAYEAPDGQFERRSPSPSDRHHTDRDSHRQRRSTPPVSEYDSRHGASRSIWYTKTNNFKPQVDDERVLHNPDSIKPQPLSKNWDQKFRDERGKHENMLAKNKGLMEKYLQDILSSDDAELQTDRIQLVQKVLIQMNSWREELNSLYDTIGEPEIEYGIQGEDFDLKDIRQKRFINCGIQCPKCKEDGRDADHPPFACNTMLEIFTHYVGPRLRYKSSWCQTCHHEGRLNISKHHSAKDCRWGMWCDHPENSLVEGTAYWKKWNHPYPSAILGYEPGKVTQMFRDMHSKKRRAAD